LSLQRKEVEPKKHREGGDDGRSPKGSRADLSIPWRDEWQTFFPRLLH